jgi:hypothetical protein
MRRHRDRRAGAMRIGIRRSTSEHDHFKHVQILTKAAPCVENTDRGLDISIRRAFFALDSHSTTAMYVTCVKDGDGGAPSE